MSGLSYASKFLQFSGAPDPTTTIMSTQPSLNDEAQVLCVAPHQLIVRAPPSSLSTPAPVTSGLSYGSEFLQFSGASDPTTTTTSTQSSLNDEAQVLCVAPHQLTARAPPLLPAESFGVLDPIYWEQAHTNASAVTTPGCDAPGPPLTDVDLELIYFFSGQGPAPTYYHNHSGNYPASTQYDSEASLASGLGLNPLQPLPQRFDGTLQGHPGAYVVPQPPLGTGSTGHGYFVPQVPQEYMGVYDYNYVPNRLEEVQEQIAAPAIAAASPSVQPSEKPLSAVGRPNEPVGSPQTVTLERKRGPGTKDRKGKGKAREEHENVAENLSVGHTEQSQGVKPRRGRPPKRAQGEDEPVTSKRRRYAKKGALSICSLCKLAMSSAKGHAKECPVKLPPAICPYCGKLFADVRGDSVDRHLRENRCKGPSAGQASNEGIAAWQGTQFTYTYPLNGETGATHATHDANVEGIVGDYDNDDTSNNTGEYENVAGPSSATRETSKKPAKKAKKGNTAQSKAKN